MQGDEGEGAAVVADKLADLQGKRSSQLGGVHHLSCLGIGFSTLMIRSDQRAALAATTPLTGPSCCAAPVDDGDLGELNLDKKKKKKKKPAAVDPVRPRPPPPRTAHACNHDGGGVQHPLRGCNAQEAANGAEDAGAAAAVAAAAAADDDGEAGPDLALGGKKKKKRKPKARADEEFGAGAEEAGGEAAAPDADKENEEDGLPAVPKLPWEGTDRDYTYQELLGAAPVAPCANINAGTTARWSRGRCLPMSSHAGGGGSAGVFAAESQRGGSAISYLLLAHLYQVG